MKFPPRSEVLDRQAAAWRAQRRNAVTFWRGRWHWLQPSWWFYGPHRTSTRTQIYHLCGSWWARHKDGKWERVP